MDTPPLPQAPPSPPVTGEAALERLLAEGVTWGDCGEWLPVLPEGSVDLWFTSPPYADARAYSRIHPDRYVEWFLPFGKYMLAATKDAGWLVLNIKNRVASSGPLQGQRHPYVYQLVLARAAAGLAVAGDLHLVQAQRGAGPVRPTDQGQLRVPVRVRQGRTNV